jgi:hypothetical protein
VANTWGAPVSLEVDFGGTPLTRYADYMRVPSGNGAATTYAPLQGGNVLAPGEVAILFLSKSSGQEPIDALHPDIECPAGVTAAYTTAHASTQGSGVSTAFHIAASRPVIAYDIFPYGGGSAAVTSATLLIPTSAWGTNYIAITPGDSLPRESIPFVGIVAQADDTHVTVNPTATVLSTDHSVSYPSGPLQGTAKGVPKTWTIQRGQVLQLEATCTNCGTLPNPPSTQTDSLGLVGSPILADKPVGVFGGANCFEVPRLSAACDSAHQQIPPISALGYEYVYARYRDRYAGVPESPPVRLVGAVDGTVLTYAPRPPQAPTAIGAGEMIEFNARSAFSVKSQDRNHPFYMAAYMTGATLYDVTGGNDGRGDPEFVNVVPPRQYLSDYVFFTDPTYPETELVLVRQKNPAGGFDEVTLDCLSDPVTGWQPIGSAGIYESTRVDLVTGNFMPVGGCNNGRHEMHSASPFGVTVWGWGSAATGESSPGTTPVFSQYVSYAYPAGMGLRSINTVIVPPR